GAEPEDEGCDLGGQLDVGDRVDAAGVHQQRRHLIRGGGQAEEHDGRQAGGDAQAGDGEGVPASAGVLHDVVAGCGGSGHGGHWAPQPARNRGPGPGGVSWPRHTVRTMAGAATKRMMSAWMTKMMSMGVLVWACMPVEPAWSAPKSRPAPTTPMGLARPSRARAMASKPTLAKKPPVRRGVLPSRIVVPPRPERPPATAIESSVVLATPMPA